MLTTRCMSANVRRLGVDWRYDCSSIRNTISRDDRMKRWLVPIMVIMLAACQTIPEPRGFAERQVSLLEAAGFERVGENYELGLQDRLLFEVDRSEILPEMVGQLSNLATSFSTVGIFGARIEGHADSTGAVDHNARLSQRRADAVKAVLIASGLRAGRIESIGMGESDPINGNDTQEGRAQNRRVVLMVRPADLEPY
jgi:outer membrane protein OmpA-like peptidoglycan-associated protein